jgi:phosphate:Na+ symporter
MQRNTFILLFCTCLGLIFCLYPEVQLIAAGVAVFLLGMINLEEGFKVFAGGVLETCLKNTTNTKSKSLLFGVVVTSLMQSSSLVSVIAISFVSAGLIPLIQGIGIIFGANLGTTTGAWLVAGFGLKVNIALYAMPILVFGVVCFLQKNQPKLRGLGQVLIGLGFLFLGIAFMKDGFTEISQGIDLVQYAMTGVVGLLVFTLVGLVVTVVMQSSHATLILTITALAAGQVSYENALALAIGSNIGTTVTAILGALSANMAGKRLAGAHLIFNVITGLLALIFIQPFILLVDKLSVFMAIGLDDYTLKLALFHSLFNLFGIMVILPFIGRLVCFLENSSLFGDEENEMIGPRYLNDAALEMTDTSLFVLRKEIAHLSELVFTCMSKGFGIRVDDLSNSDEFKTESLQQGEDGFPDINELYFSDIKPVYSAILDFTVRVEPSMTGEQAKVLSSFRQGASHLIMALKLSRELQVNCRQYSESENKYMVYEYNRLRLSLGRLLGELSRLFESKDMAMSAKGVKKVRSRINQSVILDKVNLDKLIRENLVSAELGVSLMNDSVITRRLVKIMLRAAKQIFGGGVALEQDLDFLEPDLEASDLMEQTKTQIEINIHSLDELTDQAGKK